MKSLIKECEDIIERNSNETHEMISRKIEAFLDNDKRIEEFKKRLSSTL